MDTNQQQEAAVTQIYQFAANMLVNENKNSVEVKDALVEKGLSENAAFTIISTLETQICDAKRERANKDMLYSALWCIGGVIATAANIGVIFWGAIVFGAIQFFKGVANTLNN